MLENWYIQSETKQDNGLIKIIIRKYKEQDKPLIKFWIPISALKKNYCQIIKKRRDAEFKKLGITDIGNICGTNMDLENR